MTAPGQEPDEVMTGKPGGKGADEPDLGAIGDAHMPEDVRESVRQEAADAAPDHDPDQPAPGSTDSESDEKPGVTDDESGTED